MDGSLHALNVLVVIIFLCVIVSAINRQSVKLSQLGSKVDLLMKNANIEFSPLDLITDEVRTALLDGDKITAIKIYRETTGAGLREAKDAVELLADSFSNGE